jgi:hypothetical protein
LDRNLLSQVACKRRLLWIEGARIAARNRWAAAPASARWLCRKGQKLEKLAGTKVSLQKVEGRRRLRGAPTPLLCAAVLGCWLNAGTAFALDVPPDAALKEDAELLPVTLNPPGNSLVFGADEHCSSPVPSTPGNAAANVQMDAAGLENGTQMEPEDTLLATTANTACVPLAAFAAAGEPVFAAHAAGSSFAFSATLGQLAMFAGVPAAIAGIAKAVARKKGRGRADTTLPGRGNGPGGPGGGPGGGNGGTGGGPATPTPEPVSTVLLIAGAALVGRAVQRRAGR